MTLGGRSYASDVNVCMYDVLENTEAVLSINSGKKLCLKKGRRLPRDVRSCLAQHNTKYGAYHGTIVETSCF